MTTVFVRRCLLDVVERLARMRGLTIGAVAIVVANGLAVREYRGRLHAHAAVRTRPDDSVVSIRIVTAMASAGPDL